MVSTLGGCGGLERTDILHLSIHRGCGGNERTDSSPSLYQQGVVVLKELIFTVSIYGRQWW